MQRAVVGIYVYEDKAYLPTIARIRTGGWFDTEPVFICDLDVKKIASTIEGLVARGHIVVEPTDPEMGNLRQGAVLRATKTHSWKELANKGVSYNIDFLHDQIRIDMSRLDKKGRWEFDPNKVQVLPHDTSLEVIVDLILRDVRIRPELWQNK
jgi:hypothetical protein